METGKVLDSLRALRNDPNLVHPAQIRIKDKKSQTFGVRNFEIGIKPIERSSSIYHHVPIMRLQQHRSYWYTSLQMIIAFYRNQGKGHQLKDPSEDLEIKRLNDENFGIGNTPNERDRIARNLGLMAGYKSITDEGMPGLLRIGPVIYTGHRPGVLSVNWVVITGASESSLSINNPAVGQQTWDYKLFMSFYVTQKLDKPLIYPQSEVGKTITANIFIKGSNAIGLSTDIESVASGMAFTGNSNASATGSGIQAYKSYDIKKREL
jgi:hypothetical protein